MTQLIIDQDSNKAIFDAYSMVVVAMQYFFQKLLPLANIKFMRHFDVKVSRPKQPAQTVFITGLAQVGMMAYPIHAGMRMKADGVNWYVENASIVVGTDALPYLTEKGMMPSRLHTMISDATAMVDQMISEIGLPVPGIGSQKAEAVCVFIPQTSTVKYTRVYENGGQCTYSVFPDHVYRVEYRPDPKGSEYLFCYDPHAFLWEYADPNTKLGVMLLEVVWMPRIKAMPVEELPEAIASGNATYAEWYAFMLKLGVINQPQFEMMKAYYTELLWNSVADY